MVRCGAASVDADESELQLVGSIHQRFIEQPAQADEGRYARCFMYGIGMLAGRPVGIHLSQQDERSINAHDCTPDFTLWRIYLA
jgi:hypothetical protein